MCSQYTLSKRDASLRQVPSLPAKATDFWAFSGCPALRVSQNELGRCILLLTRCAYRQRLGEHILICLAAIAPGTATEHGSFASGNFLHHEMIGPYFRLPIDPTWHDCVK
jgi:hypothetical protein